MEKLKKRAVNLTILMLGLFCAGFNSGLFAEPAEEAMKELLPNGSFEWVEHLFPAWLEHNKGKFEIPGEDPVLPVTWNLDKPGKFITESAANASHSGKHGFTIIPAPLVPGNPWRETQISCGWIEVEREATYHISAFVRGKGEFGEGSFKMYLDKKKPEGIEGEILGQINPTDSWQELSFTRKFTGNVRYIKLVIAFVVPKESKEDCFATIDDVSLKTTGKVISPLPLLTSPPEYDENTTLLDHYEDKILKGSVTQPVKFIEGRFGKGIYIGPDGYVEYINENVINAKTGTIELWLKPNNDPLNYEIQILINDGFRWCYNWGPYPDRGDIFSITWRDNGAGVCSQIWSASGRDRKGDPKPSLWNLLDRSSDREWHHIALSWDETTMLLYVDGLLVSVDDMRRPAEVIGPQIIIGDAPERLKDRAPNIGIDELRISKNMRYGTVPTPGTPPAAEPAVNTN